MKNFFLTAFTCISIICFSFSAAAETFKVAILSSIHDNMYQKLFKELGNVTNNVFLVKVLPPARAMDMIEHNLVDIQVPKIKSKNDSSNRASKYDFAEAKTGRTVAFIIYTNKNKLIDIDSIKNANIKGYRISPGGGDLYKFEYKAQLIKSAEQSLKMVETGRLDAYITAQDIGDYALKSLHLKNIRRQLWDTYEVSFTLPKGKAGGKLDKIIEHGLNILRENGKLEQIIGEINRQGKYNDWQP